MTHIFTHYSEENDEMVVSIQSEGDVAGELAICATAILFKLFSEFPEVYENLIEHHKYIFTRTTMVEFKED